MNKWSTLPSKKIIDKTIKALKKNNINAYFVETKEDAKKKVLRLIPQGAEVMTMSSVTLGESGIAKEINESGKYDSVKKKLNSMERETEGREMQKLGAAPSYAVGSVHAVTEEGQVLIASNTGSQLPAYAYGSDHVIWIVGAQKIVKNIDQGMSRIYEYVLPLESERLKKAYGVPSNVSKLLIFNKELAPDRVTIIFVNESLGF